MSKLPNVVFVLGGPGAGKGTQCTKIVEVFNTCSYLKFAIFIQVQTDDYMEGHLYLFKVNSTGLWYFAASHFAMDILSLTYLLTSKCPTVKCLAHVIYSLSFHSKFNSLYVKANYL